MSKHIEKTYESYLPCDSITVGDRLQGPSRCFVDSGTLWGAFALKNSSLTNNSQIVPVSAVFKKAFGYTPVRRGKPSGAGFEAKIIGVVPVNRHETHRDNGTSVCRDGPPAVGGNSGLHGCTGRLEL